MVNRRLVPGQRRPDAVGPGPSVAVQIHIVLEQVGCEPVDLEVHENAPFDDAMWRPDGAQAGRTESSRTEAGKHIGGDPNAPIPSPAIEILTGPGVLPHPHADIELTDAGAGDTIARRRPAESAPTPARSSIHDATTGAVLTGARREQAIAARARSRQVRRHALIAAAATVAIVAGAAMSRATLRPAASATPPLTATRTATRGADASQPAMFSATIAAPSAAFARSSLLDGENSSPVIRSPHAASADSVPRVIAHPCRHLLLAAPLIVGALPAAWLTSLIDGGARPGQTIDRAVRRKLVAARTALIRANHTDPEAIDKVNELNAIISEAADSPCSSKTCTSGSSGVDYPRTSRRATKESHAGWQWLCVP